MIDKRVMDIRKLVGLNVSRLRREKALKQEPLAEVAGFTQSYLSQIENGHVNLTLLRLNDLAQCFGVSPIEFFRPPGTDAVDSDRGE
ncbi:helix-turn-helix domain-containing protein [Novosphingobium mathurense]|uniref:Helix-turn-helix n=1 Tax=Novosphingobium mathurense TaxID=428990 RepID=A0A1U6IL99_9SPHN|nr:helix-turn-helix transcriptional regulator [Novosphingobium mathurense]SLK08781.1 Helix-turn-helix [Novosphingobium mathurense]